MPHLSRERKHEKRTGRSHSAREEAPEGMHPEMKRHASLRRHPHESTEVALHHLAPHPVGHSERIEGHIGASRAGQAPPATSLPGQLGVITNPSGGKPRPMGIPGIITSTSLGPEQRQRMVAGILMNPGMEGRNSSGAVHEVMGHDATAYNEGMVHIRGSPFTSRS